MNIKVITNPLDQIRGFVKAFFERLTQNPEFYNIRHYTKNRGRNRNQQKGW
jgi:hypothetical protein